MGKTMMAHVMRHLMANSLPLGLPSGTRAANALASKTIADMADATDALPGLDELQHWSGRLTHTAMVAGIALAAGLALHWLGFWLLRRVARRSEMFADSVAIRRFHQSVRWALVAVMIALAADADRLLAHVWRVISDIAVPALVGWVLLSLVGTVAEVLQRRAADMDDDIAARTMQTRITLLGRATGFVIVVITVGMIMLGFPGVRHVGATLLASAGLIGLAFGAAAQPALKSLIAGLQLALTEPMRIGDLVVVEGESGRVEDIHLSYVVIRTVDERRLIVPTTKFLDSAFQNWTRVGGITGSVLLPVMPGVPIAPIRAAFERLLAEQPDWDCRTAQLLVAEARVGSVELKLVMSAADPAALATLRASLREAMLEWLRQDMPDALCLQASGG